MLPRKLESLPPEVLANAIRFSIPCTRHFHLKAAHLASLLVVSKKFHQLTAPILWNTLSMDHMSLRSTRRCLDTLRNSSDAMDYGTLVQKAKLFVNVDLDMGDLPSHERVHGMPLSLLLDWIKVIKSACPNLHTLHLDMAMFVYGGWDLGEWGDTFRAFVMEVSFPRLKVLHLVNWDMQDSQLEMMLTGCPKITTLNLAHVAISDEAFHAAIGHVGHQLVSLCLDHPQEITYKTVLYALSNCPRLETLLLTDTPWPVLSDSSNLTTVPHCRQHYSIHEFSNPTTKTWTPETDAKSQDPVLSHKERIQFIQDLKAVLPHSQLRHLTLRASPPGALLELPGYQLLLLKVLSNLESLAISHHYATTPYMSTVMEMVRNRKDSEGVRSPFKRLQIGFLTGEEVLGQNLTSEREVLCRLHLDENVIKELVQGGDLAECLVFEVDYCAGQYTAGGWEGLMEGRYGSAKGASKAPTVSDVDSDSFTTDDDEDH